MKGTIPLTIGITALIYSCMVGEQLIVLLSYLVSLFYVSVARFIHIRARGEVDVKEAGYSIWLAITPTLNTMYVVDSILDLVIDKPNWSSIMNKTIWKKSDSEKK
jgi:hypothetical protein